MAYLVEFLKAYTQKRSYRECNLVDTILIYAFFVFKGKINMVFRKDQPKNVIIVVTKYILYE